RARSDGPVPAVEAYLEPPQPALQVSSAPAHIDRLVRSHGPIHGTQEGERRRRVVSGGPRLHHQWVNVAGNVELIRRVPEPVRAGADILRRAAAGVQAPVVGPVIAAGGIPR